MIIIDLYLQKKQIMNVICNPWVILWYLFHSVSAQTVRINTVTDSNHNYTQFSKRVALLRNPALSLFSQCYCSVMASLDYHNPLPKTHSDKRGPRSFWGALSVSAWWNLCQTMGYGREPNGLKGMWVSSFEPGMLGVLSDVPGFLSVSAL